MNRLSILLFALGFGICDAALCEEIDTCAPRAIHREIYPNESQREVALAMRTKVTLSPNWDDPRILSAFGFTNAIADQNNVLGADGSQTKYHLRKTKINIVRSYSTGLVVTVNKGRFRGAWLLAGCG